jgi:hypothetical protein
MRDSTPAAGGPAPGASSARAEDFVSEPIVPEPGSSDAAAMARGEPGLPAAFTWRGNRYAVARLVASWKTTGTDRGETYLRRHWYSVATATGETMTLYCERQARNRKRPKARWWVYSVRIKAEG